MSNTSANPQTSAAMDKIRDEMAKRHNDSGICSTGEVMTALLEAHPEWAKAICAEGKTLAGAYAALAKYAGKQRGKNGNSSAQVFIGPQSAMKIFMDYYGIKADPPALMIAGEPESAQPMPSADEADPLDLDALLGL